MDAVKDCVDQVRVLWQHRKLILEILDWLRQSGSGASSSGTNSGSSVRVGTATTLTEVEPVPLELSDCPYVSRPILVAALRSMRANLDTRDGPIPSIHIRYVYNMHIYELKTVVGFMYVCMYAQYE
jgi:hypothetical protein